MTICVRVKWICHTDILFQMDCALTLRRSHLRRKCPGSLWTLMCNDQKRCAFYFHSHRLQHATKRKVKKSAPFKTQMLRLKPRSPLAWSSMSVLLQSPRQQPEQLIVGVHLRDRPHRGGEWSKEPVWNFCSSHTTNSIPGKSPGLSWSQLLFL